MIPIAATIVIYSGAPDEESSIASLFEGLREMRPQALKQGVWLFRSSNLAQMSIAQAKQLVRSGTLYWTTVEDTALRRWPHA